MKFQRNGSDSQKRYETDKYCRQQDLIKLTFQGLQLKEISTGNISHKIILMHYKATVHNFKTQRDF